MIDEDDIRQVVADFGTNCVLAVSGGEPKPVFMVASEAGRGSFGSRSVLSRMVDSREARHGATYGYGLILAEDAPAELDTLRDVTVTDSLGTVWHMDTARKVKGRNEETGDLTIIGWRMALWCEQRIVTR